MTLNMINHEDYPEDVRRHIYWQCVECWGVELQYIMAFEEYSEMIQILTKMARGKTPLVEAIAEEIVDAYLMTEQLTYIWDCELKDKSVYFSSFYEGERKWMDWRKNDEARKWRKPPPTEVRIKNLLQALAHGIYAVNSAFQGNPCVIHRSEVTARVKWDLFQFKELLADRTDSFFQGVIDLAIENKFKHILEMLEEAEDEKTG